MTTHIRTVATQAFQIWLRPDEPTLGWHEPGVTISAYLRPFETWASMPQTLWTEDWPDDDRPGTVAYFCGTLNAPWPTTEEGPDTHVDTNRWCAGRPPSTSTTISARTSRRSNCGRIQLAPAQRRQRRTGRAGAGNSACERQRRSLGPVRAVHSRDRPIPASARRKRLRQLDSRGRLDGFRDERRLYRGGGDVRAGGGQRGPREEPLSPCSRLLHALAGQLSCARRSR